MDHASGDRATADGGAGVSFTPLAFDGLTWLRIDGPQRDPRSACMIVAPFIHLIDPATSRCDLESAAEKAVRLLEEGASCVSVIDSLHRVERATMRQPS